MNVFSTIGITAIAVSVASIAHGATIVNTADTLAEFSSTITVGSDFGITANRGFTGSGDNAVHLVSRSNNSHAFSWNVSAEVSATDTLKVDVLKHEGITAHANLTVRVYFDGLATPHSPVIPELGAGNVISDAVYRTLTVSLPGGGNHTIDRIDFIVTQNNVILYFDNFTLTTVPEPMSAGVLGVGSMLLMRRRRV